MIEILVAIYIIGFIFTFLGLAHSESKTEITDVFKVSTVYTLQAIIWFLWLPMSFALAMFSEKE